MSADSELPWYFGSGPSTWQGDAGLRSSLGGQIGALEGSCYLDELGVRRKGILEARSFDVGATEDRMHQRLGAAANVASIEDRLRQLTRQQVQALELHYVETSNAEPNATLPFGVPMAAVLLKRSRRLTGDVGGMGLSELRAALNGASTAEREAIAAEGAALVESARLAFDALPRVDVKPVQVDDPRDGRRLTEPTRAEPSERCASGKVWHEKRGDR